MPHAEALLLVHDQQTQILELNILVQQPVRADDHVQLAAFQVLDGLLLLGRGFEARQRVHMDGKIMESVQHGGVVLLNENRRRREQRRLLSVHHALEDGAQRHLGLAISNVAAQQAIHHLRLFHILFNLRNRRQLIGRFLKGERVLKLALPRRVRAERVALHGLALGVQLDQVARDFLDGALDLRLLLLPFAAGQAVELGRFALGADILLHAIHLIGGHVQLVGALIADVQEIAQLALG